MLERKGGEHRETEHDPEGDYADAEPVLLLGKVLLGYKEHNQCQYARARKAPDAHKCCRQRPHRHAGQRHG